MENKDKIGNAISDKEMKTIKKLVKEQFPNESTKGIGLYGWMRATQLRRLRAPAPQVEIAGRKRKK